MTTRTGATRIRRAPRTHGWTTINNAPAVDPSLSWEAVGVLVYLLTKPDDWEVLTAHLVAFRAGGRERMHRILRELRASGYLRLTRERDALGRIIDTFYEVADLPELLAREDGQPVRRETRKTAEPVYGKPDRLLKTESLLMTEEDETGVAANEPPPPAPPSDPLATPHVNGTAQAADPTPPADAWAPFYAAVSDTLGGLPVVSARTGKPLAWAGQLAGIAGKHVNGSGAAGAAVLWREFTTSRDWQYAGKPSNYPSAFGKWVGQRKGAPAAAESSLYAIADARTYRGAPVPDGEIAF